MPFGKGEGGMMRPPGSRAEFGQRNPEVTTESGIVRQGEVTSVQISTWGALETEAGRSIKADEHRTLREVLDSFKGACATARIDAGPKPARAKSGAEVMADELGIINTYLKDHNVLINRLPELTLRDIPDVHWDGYQR